MDFSKNLFHEIVVEREGFSFCVEVTCELLLDFCFHCLNLDHDVAACRWLYPRKESKVSKENAIKGKKQIPTSKLDWEPIKENPSGFGSSNALKVIVPATTTKEAYIVESLVATPVAHAAQNNP